MFLGKKTFECLSEIHKSNNMCFFTFSWKSCPAWNGNSKKGFLASICGKLEKFSQFSPKYVLKEVIVSTPVPHPRRQIFPEKREEGFGESGCSCSQTTCFNRNQRRREGRWRNWPTFKRYVKVKEIAGNYIRRDSKLVPFFRAIRPGLGQAGKVFLNGLGCLGFTH